MHIHWAWLGLLHRAFRLFEQACRLGLGGALFVKETCRNLEIRLLVPFPWLSSQQLSPLCLCLCLFSVSVIVSFSLSVSLPLSRTRIYRIVSIGTQAKPAPAVATGSTTFSPALAQKLEEALGSPSKVDQLSKRTELFARGGISAMDYWSTLKNVRAPPMVVFVSLKPR